MFFMKTIHKLHKKTIWDLPAGTKVQAGFPTMTYIFVILNKNISFIEEIYTDNSFIDKIFWESNTKKLSRIFFE